MHFSENEIQDELGRMGFHDVDDKVLKQFSSDLDRLVETSSSSYQSKSFDSQQFSNNSQEGIPKRKYYSPIAQPLRYRSDLQKPAQVRFQLDKGRIRKPLEDSQLTDLTNTALNDSTTSSERHVFKRKTLRRHDDSSSYIDESFTEDSSDETPARYYGNVTPRIRAEILKSNRRPMSAQPLQDISDEFEVPVRRTKSVIWETTEHPHWKNIQRQDPVSLYQKYNECWQRIKAPGEKSHDGLRWDIREQMLYYDPVVKKKQHTYIPNDYVVPTSKKRQALRWRIRESLAEGHMPL